MGIAPLGLIVQPPIYDFALYDLYLQPLGLARAAAWLKRGGWDVHFIDALDYRDENTSRKLKKPKRSSDGTGKLHRSVVASPEILARYGEPGRSYARYGILAEEFVRRLKAAVEENGALRPDAVFIGGGMTYWYPGIVETVHTVRQLWPGTLIVTGGIYPSLMPRHCEETTGADCIVQRSDFSGLNAMLHERNLPVPEGDAPIVPLLEPSFRKDAGVLEMNRGCPMNCRYCASRYLRPSFDAGNADRLYSWFRELYDQGLRHFAFYDDALLYRFDEYLRPFLERVIGEKLNVSFYTPNAVHIRYLSPDAAGLMKKSGFREVRIGFESPEAGFHDTYDGKFRPEQFSSSVKILKNAGFSGGSIRAYILAGMPGQYSEEAEDAVRAAADAGVIAALARYSPVPGSSLWEESVRNSRYPLEEEPLFHNNTFFPLEWSGFTRGDLERIHQTALSANRKLLGGQ